MARSFALEDMTSVKPWDIKLQQVPGLLMFPGANRNTFVVMDKEEAPDPAL